MMGNFKRENISVTFKAEIADNEGKDDPRLQKMSKYIEKYIHVRAGSHFRTGLSFLFYFPSLQREEDGFCVTLCSRSISHGISA